MTERFGLIDLLKGVCIIVILAVHSIVFFTQGFEFLALFSQAAVFALVVLLSYNYFGSMKRNSLRAFYYKRLRAYAPPIAVAWVFSALAGIALGVKLRFGGQQAIGFFPVPGAGNYFVPLLIQLVLLTPVFYWLFKEHRFFFTVFSFSIAIFCLLVDFSAFYWHYNIIRFIPFVWIGFFCKLGKFFDLDHSVPIVNWFGRNSLKIFLGQIIFFSNLNTLGDFI